MMDVDDDDFKLYCYPLCLSCRGHRHKLHLDLIVWLASVSFVFKEKKRGSASEQILGV